MNLAKILEEIHKNFEYQEISLNHSGNPEQVCITLRELIGKVSFVINPEDNILEVLKVQKKRLKAISELTEVMTENLEDYNDIVEYGEYYRCGDVLIDWECNLYQIQNEEIIKLEIEK